MHPFGRRREQLSAITHRTTNGERRTAHTENRALRLLAALGLVVGLLVTRTPSPASATSALPFTRTDYAVAQPESVVAGNLDGKHGPDLVVTMPSSNAVGVMLNKGSGAFGKLRTYKACPQAGLGPLAARLGDITTPKGGYASGDGKLDVVVACPPYVVVLPGWGNGTLGTARSYNLGLAAQNGIYTQELIGLASIRAKGPRVLVFQQGSSQSSPHYLCAAFDFKLSALACDRNVPVMGPMAIGRLNPYYKGDFIVMGTGTRQIVAFVYSRGWLDSIRKGGPSEVESAALGDLNGDGYNDILMGHLLNPSGPPPNRLPNAMTFLRWDPKKGILPYTTPASISSINGLDAVTIADFNRDGHKDVFAAGDYGRAVIHLGLGNGKFDTGRDVPLIGYRNPATATRVTLSLADFNCDKRPDVAIADELDNAVMVLRNGNTGGKGCA